MDRQMDKHKQIIKITNGDKNDIYRGKKKETEI